VIEEDLLLTSDDIRRTLIQEEHHADCYIDYYSSEINRSHHYSLLLDWNMYIVSQIIFLVICLWVFDIHSFEHGFYARVSRAFLLIHSLSIYNIKEQKKKYFFRTYWLCKIIFSRHKYMFTLSEITWNQIWPFDNFNREFDKRYNTYHLYIIETYCFRKPNSICEKFWSSSSLCESIVR